MWAQRPQAPPRQAEGTICRKIRTDIQLTGEFRPVGEGSRLVKGAAPYSDDGDAGPIQPVLYFLEGGHLLPRKESTEMTEKNKENGSIRPERRKIDFFPLEIINNRSIPCGPFLVHRSSFLPFLARRSVLFHHRTSISRGQVPIENDVAHTADIKLNRRRAFKHEDDHAVAFCYDPLSRENDAVRTWNTRGSVRRRGFHCSVNDEYLSYDLDFVSFSVPGCRCDASLSRIACYFQP